MDNYKSMDHIIIPENMDEFIERCVEKGAAYIKKNRAKRKIAFWSSLAACFVGFMVICVSIPTFASKIPFIGHIFADLEEEVSFRGDYSENGIVLEETIVLGEDVVVTNQDSNSTVGKETEINESIYTKTDGALTVTFSEYYCDQNALYMTIIIENKDGFVGYEGQDEKYLNLPVFELRANQEISFLTERIKEDGFYGFTLQAEGNYIDENTYIGIIRCDIAEYLDYYEVQLPSTFTYKMDIFRIFNYVRNGMEDTITYEQANWNGKEVFLGKWDFEFEIRTDNQSQEIYDINNFMDDETGVLQIKKTIYEMKIDLLYEQDQWVVAFDQDGNFIENPLNSTIANPINDYYEWSFVLKGKKLKGVHVLILDRNQYLDEWKGQYYDGIIDGQEFLEFLKEKADYYSYIELE